MFKIKFKRSKKFLDETRKKKEYLGQVTGMRLVLGYLGVLLMITGVIILLPLIMYIFYPSEAISTFHAFLVPGLLTVTLGFLLSLFIYRKQKTRLENHEDIILVLFYWIFTILFGSLPFLFLKDFEGNYLKCLFESTSAFTTTGFSMITNYADVPKVFFFYRTVMLFFGGIGLILILNSALSDKFNMRLYTADGHSDMLLPNIVKSARLILSIYSGYILVGTLVLFGIGQIGTNKMEFFDAFCYTTSCLSLGGFGTSAQSIGAYNSIGVEVVTCILMLLGTTNFLIHVNLLRLRFKNVFMHDETKTIILYLLILAPIISVVGIYLNPNNAVMTANLGNSFRVTFFTFISAFTTAGLANFSVIGADSILILGSSFMFITSFAMFFGGMAGSTAGGLKLSRTIIFIKGTLTNYYDQLTNKRKVKYHYTYRFGKKVELDQETYKSTVVFTLTFLFISAVATLCMIIFGMDTIEALFTTAGSISNVGLGSIYPTSNAGILVTSMILMVLGRIEITPIISAFAIMKNRIEKRHF